MIPGLSCEGMFGGASIAPLSYVYNKLEDYASITSWEEKLTNFGADGATRTIVALIRTYDDGARYPQVSWVTIAGVTATLVYLGGFTSGPYTFRHYLAFADVPTGATGYLRIGVSNYTTTVRAGVYSVYGARQSVNPTTLQAYSSNTNQLTITYNAPEGGVSMGLASQFAAGSSTRTWSGLTKDVDGGPGTWGSAAHANPVTNFQARTNWYYTDTTIQHAIIWR